MFRYFVMAFFLLLASELGTSWSRRRRSSRCTSKTTGDAIAECLEAKVVALKARLDGADVSCLDQKATSWTGRSDAKIMNLDRHNVDCPSDYFLSRFQLKRDGHQDDSNVRYEYKCCKFVIPR